MTNISRILHHDDDVCTAIWRDVFVIIWRRNTTIEGVKACDRTLTEARPDLPKGCGALTIVEPGAPMPSAEAREALSLFLREAGDVIQLSAVVYEGAGFRAAAVRSVVTGISLVAKQPFPHKVFATVAAASSWMAPSLPVGPAASRDVIQAVADLREDLARLTSDAAASATTP